MTKPFMNSSSNAARTPRGRFIQCMNEQRYQVKTSKLGIEYMLITKSTASKFILKYRGKSGYDPIRIIQNKKQLYKNLKKHGLTVLERLNEVAYVNGNKTTLLAITADEESVPDDYYDDPKNWLR